MSDVPFSEGVLTLAEECPPSISSSLAAAVAVAEEFEEEETVALRPAVSVVVAAVARRGHWPQERLLSSEPRLRRGADAVQEPRSPPWMYRLRCRDPR